MSAAPAVSVVAADLPGEAMHALEVLLGAIGARLERASGDRPPTGVCLHYGTPTGEAHAGCAFVPRRPDDRLWRDLLDGNLAPQGLDHHLRFDVVSATIALLGDHEHQDRSRLRLDRHGRLRRADSFHGAAGYGALPIVNRYAAALEVALSAAGLRDPVPRWPEGKRYAIGLSHDVDRPDKYAVLRALRRPGTWLRRPYLVARAGRDLVLRLRDRSPEDFWLFDPLMGSEARRAMRSTFLFAAMPSQGGWGTRHDVHYDIGWTRFAPVFERMRAEGVEIGLHAAYAAHRGPRRLDEERRRLEELAGVAVQGLRHHYWQLGPDVTATLRAHEAAGFAYDSSLAFPDRIGLRRGIALPFRPWDAALGRPLRVLQLPVLAMDGAVCAEATSPEQAAAELWSALE
ncbi:MAG TPA: hypothetical protein VF013_07650, partial [Candidatus Limnocylindria bacterium]